MRFSIIAIFAAGAIAAPQFPVLSGIADALQDNGIPFPITSTVVGAGGSILENFLGLQSDIAGALSGLLPWNLLTVEQQSQLVQIQAAVKAVVEKDQKKE